MIKMLLRICVFSLFCLLSGYSQACTYHSQNSHLNAVIAHVVPKQATDFVALPNHHVIFNHIVCGTNLEKSDLEAIEDFIDEEDETELLPYKKNTEVSAYFIAHYRSQSIDYYHSYLAKSLQKDSNISCLSGINKYALFCVFRI